MARDLARVRIQTEDESQPAWESFKARAVASTQAAEQSVDRFSTAWDRFLGNAKSSWERMSEELGPQMERGLELAKSAFQQFVDHVKSKMVITGVAIALGVSAAVIGAIYAVYKGVSFAVGLITGESYKSENIDALIALNKEVKTLQESLPLTAVGASALNEALKAQGVSASGYAATLHSVEAASRTNAEELDRLGVKYKDQNGVLLSTEERLKSALGVLQQYKEGWDRQQAAAAIGMGSEKEIQEALKITAERTQTAKDRLIDYNLVIGVETQRAVARYETSMREFERESDLTSQGFKRAIADNIMPALTDLADFFKEGFPFAVNAFRYSMATVTSLFYGLKTVVYLVAESILGGVSSIGIMLDGLASAAGRALKGDFSGAKDALLKGWEDAKTRLGLIGDNIVEQVRRNVAAMKLAWGFESLGANGEPDKRSSAGKAWTPKPSAAAETGAAVESPFQRMMNGLLEEELRLKGELTTVDKLALDIGKLKLDAFERLTIAEQVELEYVAHGIDLKKEEIRVNKAWVEGLDQAMKKQDELEKILGNVNEAHSQARQDLEFETRLLGMEQGALNTFGLTQAEIVKKTLEFNVARETEIQLRKLNLQEMQQEKQINALLLDDYERAAALKRLYDSTAEQREALPGLMRSKLTAQSAVDQIKETQAEARRFSDDLNRALTDSLFRSFESGDSFGRTMFRNLKAYAATTVFQPLVRLVFSPISNAITGTIASLGIPGLANAAGGGGGGVSSLSSLLGLGNSAANIAGGAGSGLYGSFATSSIGQALGLSSIVPDAIGLGALEGGGALSITGLGAGLGTAIPAVGLALAAASALGLFKSNKKPAQFTGTILRGSASEQGFMGSSYGTSQGDHFSEWEYPYYAQAAKEGGLDKLIGDTFAQMRNLAKAMGLSTDLSGFSANINIGGLGESPEAMIKGFADNIGQLTDSIAIKLMPSLRDFAQGNETLTETFTRLAQAQRQADLEGILGRMSGVVGVSNDLQDLFLSDLSPLTAGERFSRSQSDFARLLAGAEGGDLESIGGLSKSARAYLQEARSYSPGQYTSVFNDVQSSVTQLVDDTLLEQSRQFADMGLTLKDIESAVKNMDSRVVEALTSAATANVAAQAALMAARQADTDRLIVAQADAATAAALASASAQSARMTVDEQGYD